MHSFLLPVEGLAIAGEWPIGSVTFRRADQLDPILARPAADPALAAVFDGYRDEHHIQVFAAVEAADFDSALAQTDLALDVLRVWQQKRAAARTLRFGLSGDTYQSMIYYAVLGQEIHHGARHRGEFTNNNPTGGVELQTTPAMEFVADTVGREDLTEGERRAQVAVQLISQGLRSPTVGLQVLSLVSAAESLLLEDKKGSQSFQLARRSLFFTTGPRSLSPCSDPLGYCVLLVADPGTKPDLEHLKALQGGVNPEVSACTDWSAVMGWYDKRSEVAHGRVPSATELDVNRLTYWLTNRLLEPVIEFLAAHPHQPIAALDSEINQCVKAAPTGAVR